MYKFKTNGVISFCSRVWLNVTVRLHFN